jgi:hypothetical protein
MGLYAVVLCVFGLVALLLAFQALRSVAGWVHNNGSSPNRVGRESRVSASKAL